MATKTLIIERVFDAPRDLVWKAWTNPEIMKQWWGPKNFTAPHISIDFKVGGKYLYCMHGSPAEGAPEQDFWSTGIFKEIIPNEKIVASDSFADENGNVVSASHYGMGDDFPMELEMTVIFEDIEDGKTKMTLHHSGFPEEQDVLASQGWNEQFDKLDQLFKEGEV
jgi:uncharacterized protein YndB with AHSA1/START domain